MQMTAKVIYNPAAGDRLTFRGCMWDDHWEFDAPCVLYSPICRYGIGGNSGHIYEMVENACINLSIEKMLYRGWRKSDLKEFDWRRWGTRFGKRLNAWHREIVVEFCDDLKHEGEEVTFRVISDKQWWGKDGYESACENDIC